jgi:hypothetical protein
MVNTKITQRKMRKCQICSKLFGGDEEFSRHIVACAMTEEECEFRDFTSEKHSNVVLHMKRAHKGLMEQPTPLVRHPLVDISVNRTNGGKLRCPLGVKRTYRLVGVKVEKMIRVALW